MRPQQGGQAQYGHPHPQRGRTPPNNHSPPPMPQPPPPTQRCHSPERRPLAPDPHQIRLLQQHSQPQQRRRSLSPSWHGRASRGSEPKRLRIDVRDQGDETRDYFVADGRAGDERFGRGEERAALDGRAQSPVFVAHAAQSPVFVAPATAMDASPASLSTSVAPASPQYHAPPSPVCDIATMPLPSLC